MRTEKLYLWFGRWRFDGGDVGIGGRSVLGVGFGGGFGVFGERDLGRRFRMEEADMVPKKQDSVVSVLCLLCLIVLCES